MPSLVILLILSGVVVLVHLVTELVKRDLAVVGGIKLLQMVLEGFRRQRNSRLFESALQEGLELVGVDEARVVLVVLLEGLSVDVF